MEVASRESKPLWFGIMFHINLYLKSVFLLIIRLWV